jgi:hypothetical protein
VFGWSLNDPEIGTDREGLAIHHLGSDALAYHIRKTTPAATPARVTSIAPYKGRLLFTVSGDGLYYEDLTKYVTQAELISSIADWNNAGDKVWDTLEVGHKALPANTSVSLDYTKVHPEGGGTWLAGLTSSGTGEESERLAISQVTSRIFAVRIRSNATSDGVSAPEDITFNVRSNPKPRENEFRLTRYVRLLATDGKDEFGETVRIDPVVVLKELQDHLYTWVYLYEPGFNWFCRVDEVSLLELLQPVVSEIAGQSEREGFMVRLSLLGTRE